MVPHRLNKILGQAETILKSPRQVFGISRDQYTVFWRVAKTSIVQFFVVCLISKRLVAIEKKINTIDNYHLFSWCILRATCFGNTSLYYTAWMSISSHHCNANSNRYAGAPATAGKKSLGVDVWNGSGQSSSWQMLAIQAETTKYKNFLPCHHVQESVKSKYTQGPIQSDTLGLHVIVSRIVRFNMVYLSSWLVCGRILGQFPPPDQMSRYVRHYPRRVPLYVSNTFKKTNLCTVFRHQCCQTARKSLRGFWLPFAMFSMLLWTCSWEFTYRTS